MPYSSASDHVVTVRVTGMPNLDINLTVNDGDGLHGATADEGQAGEGEVLHRRAIDGPLVITVGETRREGCAARRERERSVHAVRDRGGRGRRDASRTTTSPTRIRSTHHELRGYLDTRSDVDLLRWNGADGTYNIIVRADGLPLAWHTSDGKLRTPGSAQLHLAKDEPSRSSAPTRRAKGPCPRAIPCGRL